MCIGVVAEGSDFDRFLLFYIASLDRLGIVTTVRTVDEVPSPTLSMAATAKMNIKANLSDDRTKSACGKFGDPGAGYCSPAMCHRYAIRSRPL